MGTSAEDQEAAKINDFKQDFIIKTLVSDLKHSEAQRIFLQQTSSNLMLKLWKRHSKVIERMKNERFKQSTIAFMILSVVTRPTQQYEATMEYDEIQIAQLK